MENEKICEECVHYERIYKKKSTLYRPNGGFCKFRRGRIVLPVEEGCNRWEMREENRAEQEKSLKAVLLDMSDRLNQLIQIFKNEE